MSLRPARTCGAGCSFLQLAGQLCVDRADAPSHLAWHIASASCRARRYSSRCREADPLWISSTWSSTTEIRSASCGKELPGEFPFCPFCAAPLTEQPAAPVHEERKVVSVLFCDLVGFTAASEQADPEDVRARIRPYHARLRQEIEHYGGTVEKFVGDAVMAVFGAPVAHEDDAERAVRAGLSILEAIAELNEAEPDLDLHVRVGINTGEAVVALGARPELGEGMVTGDVVNTAAASRGQRR